jgi:hypothetical protein
VTALPSPFQGEAFILMSRFVRGLDNGHFRL